jgi:hypothetical protein
MTTVLLPLWTEVPLLGSFYLCRIGRTVPFDDGLDAAGRPVNPSAGDGRHPPGDHGPTGSSRWITRPTREAPVHRVRRGRRPGRAVPALTAREGRVRVPAVAPRATRASGSFHQGPQGVVRSVGLRSSRKIEPRRTRQGHAL